MSARTAGQPRTAGPDPSAAHLAARLRIIEGRVGAAVERRRAVDPDPGDRFRGLYITDEQVDDLLSRGATGWGSAEGAGAALPDDALAAVEADADAAELRGATLRLRRLARTFGLADIDIDLLLVALAPDLDPRFERLYGYLHDDVSRRRASTGLALELAGHPGLTTAGAARARLGFHGPLVAGGLLLVEDPDRPFLTRSLRVPDRVTAHLLGDDAPDAAIAGLMGTDVDVPLGDVEGFARGLAAGIPLAYVRQRAGASGRALAHAAFRRLGRRVVDLDLTRLAPSDDPAALARIASREARLLGGGLIAGPVDAISARGAAAVRAFAEEAPPVVLVGGTGWDPAWGREPPLLIDAPVPSPSERHDLWVSALGDTTAPGFDPAVATLAFRLDPEQVVRAAQAAHRASIAAGRPLTEDDVAAGARAPPPGRRGRRGRGGRGGGRWGGGAGPAPGPAGQLGRRTRRGTDDRAHLVERDPEQVVQHERGPLARVQRVEHHEQREGDLVRLLRGGLRVGVEAGHDRVGQVHVDRILAPGRAGAQQVEADPADHGGQPAAQVVHRAGVRPGHPQPGLLHGVVRLGRRAQHPVRDPAQVCAVVLELVGQLLLRPHGQAPPRVSVNQLTSRTPPM